MTRLRISSESGMAIMVAVMVMLISSIAIASYLSTVIYESRHSVWQKHRVRALFMAEAGIEGARTVLRDSSFGSALRGADGVGGTGDDGILSFGSTASLGSGGYEVRIADNDDGDNDPFTDNDDTVIGTSKGIAGREDRTVQTHLSRHFFVRYAVLVDGNLVINGDPTVQGKYGSVHANLDLMIYGNPIIDKHATASGNYIVTGGPLIGGKSGGGYP